MRGSPTHVLEVKGPNSMACTKSDLAPLDFFLGHIKNIVYSENITDISHLKHHQGNLKQITAAIATVTPQMFYNT